MKVSLALRAMRWLRSPNPKPHPVAAEDDTRRRKLETLPALVAARGRAAEGRKIFETGKGACSAGHRIGNVGNLFGPDLSTIGQIRTERDILESIFFPSATLSRAYEAHTIETADGQSRAGTPASATVLRTEVRAPIGAWTSCKWAVRRIFVGQCFTPTLGLDAGVILE